MSHFFFLVLFDFVCHFIFSKLFCLCLMIANIRCNQFVLALVFTIISFYYLFTCCCFFFGSFALLSHSYNRLVCAINFVDFDCFFFSLLLSFAINELLKKIKINTLNIELIKKYRSIVEYVLRELNVKWWREEMLIFSGLYHEFWRFIKYI